MSTTSTDIVADRLQRLGLTLPKVPAPLASYVPAVQVGQIVYTSGQLPLRDGELVAQGLVGDGPDHVTTEDATFAARVCTLNALAAIHDVLGSLDRITRIVKMTAFVASASGFTRQPTVANGASDFLGELFGEGGNHARSAVGAAQLPLNAPVEVELIVESA